MYSQPAVGRHQIQYDTADRLRISGLSALLDHDVAPWKPGILPPLGHWLHFLPQARHSVLGTDGHPINDENGLFPDFGLPRRMWAGSRIVFLNDIPLGMPIVRTSTLIAATPKEGQSGRMVFVTVRHEIATERGAVAIVDEQDIVFREAAAAGSIPSRPAATAVAEDPVTRCVIPDPTMLFRYSALTFNAHRIHYDRAYAQDIESYPGLVVQGPLIATLLLDHLLSHRPEAEVRSYSFRATSPLFDGETIHLGIVEEDGKANLRAIGPAGTAMTAVAAYAK